MAVYTPDICAEDEKGSPFSPLPPLLRFGQDGERHEFRGPLACVPASG